MTTATQTYRFLLVLAGVSEATVELAEALFESCDDCSPWSSRGVVSVGFDREAESLGDAIGSAIRDVEQAGFQVARVEVEQAVASEPCVTENRGSE